jgi:MFS transporter, PAT family, beta-lactamase induction signal transducer AmpG
MPWFRPALRNDFPMVDEWDTALSYSPMRANDVSGATVAKAPHPLVWLVLYLPFGALTGFVSIALTFVATKEGLSISEGALLTGSQLLISWLKWVWAPLVDVTLSPRKWYAIATVGTGAAVLAMSAMPLAASTLPYLIAVIALASFLNSVVGMAIEAMIAGSVQPTEIGRVSGWFQAGNLGGNGIGGGLGLLLMQHLPARWMGGAVLGTMFVLCTMLLSLTPRVAPHKGDARGAAMNVARDLVAMLKTRGGLLCGVLCFVPIGTGAAQSALAQAQIAGAWGAGEREIAVTQGFLSVFVTAAGCFAGGWLCKRMRPRTAYACVGVLMTLVTALMAALPHTVYVYVALSMIYAFVTGLAYAGFTALVLDGMGKGSGATKYNVFASLSNFPIWWLGLLLGFVAAKVGARAMLLTESLCGIAGVLLFAVAQARISRSSLPETV